MSSRPGNREHQPFSVRAEADIPAARFVKQGTAVNGAVKCGTAGEHSFGVSKFAIASGEVGLVHGDGDLLVEASEAITVGAEVSTTNDGSSKISASTNQILAHAVTASAADGDLHLVRMVRGKALKA